MSKLSDRATLLAEMAELRTQLDTIRKDRDRWQELAMLDKLTGLPNRRAFENELEQRLAAGRKQGRTLAVLLVDLRNLKGINHDHGMAEADNVLRYVARKIRLALRVEDRTFLARLAGDEFAIIIDLEHRNKEVVRLIAERIYDSVSGVYRSRKTGYRIMVSVSVGGHLMKSGSAETLYHLVARNLEAAKEISYAPPNVIAPIVVTD